MYGGDCAPPHLSAALPIRPCREGVEKVLGSLILSSEELAYGRTKIFIRSPKTVSQEVLPHLVAVECGALRKRKAAFSTGLDGA